MFVARDTRYPESKLLLPYSQWLDQRPFLHLKVMNRGGDVRTPARQSGINKVPGVPEAMFRVGDVSCDSALAVGSMHTGAWTLGEAERRCSARSAFSWMSSSEARLSPTGQPEPLHRGRTLAVVRLRCLRPDGKAFGGATVTCQRPQ